MSKVTLTLPAYRIILSLIFWVFILTATDCFAQVDIEKIKWIHGTSDCSQNKDSFAQVVLYDSNTYIIRQNKCLNYEAPFLYLFIGYERALLVDTGAKTELSFPIYQSITQIIGKKTNRLGEPLPLTVIHSHGHGDHKANDFQFLNKPVVALIGADKESLLEFFQFKNWPNESVKYHLGGRELTIIPIPGHDMISIALYDSHTKWLLTGDTVYPGRLYVRDWSAFKNSIDRLIRFCENNAVTFLMGNHIEMTNQSEADYPTGTTYQPKEHALPLQPGVLIEIRDACKGKTVAPTRDIHSDFIIEAVH